MLQHIQGFFFAMEGKIQISKVQNFKLLGYQRYKFYLNGEIRPCINNDNDNLRQGTSDAKRYQETINSSAKRKFTSRCAYMHRNRKNRLKTFILTYKKREWNTDQERIEIVKQSKKDINTFLTHLRKKFNCSSYAYTIEATKKKEVHFHFIVDMPFTDIKELNNTWCKIRGEYSNNAVRHLRAVKNQGRAVQYAAKYLSKSDQGDNELLKGFRRWTTSNNLSGKEFIFLEEKDIYEIIDFNQGKESVNINTGELLPALKTREINIKDKHENTRFLYYDAQLNYNFLQKNTDLAFKLCSPENLKQWDRGYKVNNDKENFARDYIFMVKNLKYNIDLFGDVYNDKGKKMKTNVDYFKKLCTFASLDAWGGS